MKVGEDVIRDIVRRVLSVASPDRILLFGSAATGEMTADSDIDLLVLADTPANPRDASVVVRRALRGMGFPFDVVVMRAADFEATKDLAGSLAYPVHRHGRTIYGIGA